MEAKEKILSQRERFILWTLTLTASIGEDNSPFQDDNECEAYWNIGLGGMDGIIAVIDEE